MAPARTALVLAGIAALVTGALLAALPFRFEIGAGEDAVRARSGPPIVAAWSSAEPGPVAAWAVTDGNTGEHWREARFGAEPYAAGKSRVRLAIGASLFVAGAVTLLALMRRRRRI